MKLSENIDRIKILMNIDESHHTKFLTSEQNRPRYSDEELRNIASKYTSKKDWRKNDSGSYHVAHKRKDKTFFDDITSHMVRPKLDRAYTDEQLRDSASRYKTKKDWRKNEDGAYVVAWRRGTEFFNDITSHMKPLGSRIKRLIYAAEFPDNSVYVGLTYDESRRKKQHLDDISNQTKNRKSAVYQHYKETGMRPEFKILTGLLDLDESQKQEENFLKKYQNDGWKILNRVKTGGLGGSYQIYSDEVLRNIAKKYKTKEDWKDNEPSSQTIARKRPEFYKDITSHMVRPPSDKLIYTDDVLRNIAKKYKTKKEWSQNEPSSLGIARRRPKEFYKDITSHMKELNRYEPYTEEELAQIAKKYTKKTEWESNDSAAKAASYKRGLDFVNKITSHMIPSQQKLTDEQIRDSAKQYQTKNEWRNNDPAAWRKAVRRKEFYQDVTSHMR